MLYHSIITSKVFVNVACILFLNKADLLRRKCLQAAINQKQSIVLQFPEYKGDPTDWRQVFKFIEKLFLSSNTRPEIKDERIRRKKVYSHMVSQE